MDEAEALLATAIDGEHLFRDIGVSGDDSVFVRSFSVLLVPLMLEHDFTGRPLDPGLVRRTLEAVLRYAQTERDFRGYVAGSGWAHASAHTSDALDALGYLEDDRLAFAASSIVRGGRLPDQAIALWLDSFQLLDDRDEQGTTLGGANAEHFLRSLYFRLLHTGRLSPWLGPIESALARFDIYQL